MSATGAYDTSGEPAIEPERRALDGELRCPSCGEVIGVYEPLVACEGSHARITSRAAEPDLDTTRGAYYHRACYVEGD